MLNFLPGPVSGIISIIYLSVNTVFWSTPLFFFAILKALIPIKPFRKICDILINGSANNWIFCNNIGLRLFKKITWDLEGVENLKPKDWYLVLSNHQTWVDILVLQKIFYKKIPFLKFFLKKELVWVPVLGVAWWALDFPFMKRYTKEFIKKNPHLEGKDLDITKKACEKFKTIPVSVMNFVEGTRLTKEKHEKQKSPYKHLLKPKSGGIAFVLSAMGEYMNSILDVSIVYPGGVESLWEFLCSPRTEIRIRVRNFPIGKEHVGNYFDDEKFRNAFQEWLNTFWDSKDKLLEEMLTS